MTDAAVMSSVLAQPSANSILTSLRGQSIVLPDLNAILDGWPREINRHYDQLHSDVNNWLDSAFSHSSKLKALKAMDLGYFGSTWWPQAPYERMRIATFLMAWLFAWDDELDMDDGSMWDKLELADSYRNDTLDYLRACLGLSSSSHLESVKSDNATIQAFGIIGKAIRHVYNDEQRLRFMIHCEEYVNMTRQEQVLNRRKTLPSVEEFWSYRLGSSAGHIVVALTEFTWDNKNLPTSVMESASMKLLWDYTNIIISTVNDILSLKKEIASGSIGSMVPLLYAQSGDVQAAINQTADFLAATVAAFDETTKRLQEVGQEECKSPEETRALDDFIKGCRFYCSGNLTWSLVTRRYGIFEKDLSAGIRVTL